MYPLISGMNYGTSIGRRGYSDANNHARQAVLLPALGTEPNISISVYSCPGYWQWRYATYLRTITAESAVTNMEPRTASIFPVRLYVITFTLLMPCTAPTAVSPTATSSSALCNKNQYYNVRHYQCLDKCGNDTRCGLHQICDQQQGRCRDLCGENDDVTCEFTQYCDRERGKCLQKCGIHPGCKLHQICDRYHGDCLDLCGENDTITCNVMQHCDRNLGMCLDRCGPGNNTKCGQFEYCDRDREVCLDLCGPDNNVKCREDEYCEAKRNTPVCTNYCYNECYDTPDNPMFCDTTTLRCEPCHTVCDAYHIRHFPDCKIFCNDVFREFNEKPNGSLITEELSYVTTTKVLLMADHPSNNTSLIIGVLAVVLFVMLVAIIWLVVFRFKRKTKFKGCKSTRSFLGCCGRNEYCTRRRNNSTGLGEISAKASDQTQITTVDDQGDEGDLNESQQALMKHSPHVAEVHAVATSGVDSRSTEANEILPSQHESESSVRQSSLTQSDGTNLHNSSHERVTMHDNEHLSLSSGGQDKDSNGDASLINHLLRPTHDRTSAKLACNLHTGGHSSPTELLNLAAQAPHHDDQTLLPKRNTRLNDSTTGERYDSVSNINYPETLQQKMLPSHKSSIQSLCSDAESVPMFKDNDSIHISLNDRYSLPDGPLALPIYQTSLSHSHESLRGALDIDLEGKFAESPSCVEEKLSVPQQATESHSDWRDVLQMWRHGRDLDLREDGNLPDDDTVSGFENSYQGNPHAAASATTTASSIPQHEMPLNIGVNQRHSPRPDGQGFNGMGNMQINLLPPGNQAGNQQQMFIDLDDLMRIPLAPHQQADVDERAYLSQIISGFQFVVYHLFSPNTVTVSVRPSDITLGEAKRVLIEAGVPEDMLEVELFRYADDSIDSGVDG